MKPLIKQLDEEFERIETEYVRRRDALSNLSKYALAIGRVVENNPLVYTTSVIYNEIFIYASPNAFLSFEEPRFIELLERIEEITGVELTSTDYPDANFRSYTSFPIKVFATLKDDSMCQRVIVGTKKELQRKYEDVEVEVPVYEFKC